MGRTVGEHVGEHGDLVMQRSTRPNELVDLGRYWSAAEPLHKRIKQQLATPYTSNVQSTNRHNS